MEPLLTQFTPWRGSRPPSPPLPSNPLAGAWVQGWMRMEKGKGTGDSQHLEAEHGGRPALGWQCTLRQLAASPQPPLLSQVLGLSNTEGATPLGVAHPLWVGGLRPVGSRDVRLNIPRVFVPRAGAWLSHSAGAPEGT